MDADDISLPTRFEKEMTEFEKDPNLSVVGCTMIHFDENGDWGTAICKKNYPEPKDLVYGTIHSHATCLIKTEAMRAVQGYSDGKRLIRVEDWHLWIKIYSSGRYGKNINEPLYKMRDDQKCNKPKKV